MLMVRLLLNTMQQLRIGGFKMKTQEQIIEELQKENNDYKIITSLMLQENATLFSLVKKCQEILPDDAPFKNIDVRESMYGKVQ